jgi:hypothetical protein
MRGHGDHRKSTVPSGVSAPSDRVILKPPFERAGNTPIAAHGGLRRVTATPSFRQSVPMGHAREYVVLFAVVFLIVTAFGWWYCRRK